MTRRVVGARFSLGVHDELCAQSVHCHTEASTETERKTIRVVRARLILGVHGEVSCVRGGGATRRDGAVGCGCPSNIGRLGRAR